MPTVIIGNNTGDDFAGNEEVGIREGNPTLNFDGYGYSQIDHWTTKNKGLISFSGLSNLPSSITVSSAAISLHLFAEDAGITHTTSFRRLLRNWVESQATWNIWSTGNNWTTAGALSDGNDRVATVSDTLTTPTTTGVYYTTDDSAQIRTDIENIASGTNANYGWDFERSDGGALFGYKRYSAQDVTDGTRPYLTVTYTAGGGLGIPLAAHHYNHNTGSNL